MKNSIPLSQMLMRNNFCRRIKGLRVTPVQLAFVLLVGFPIGTTAQTTDKEVVVFDNAHSEVPYRIPALAYTRDGRLIAVCDYRISKSDIGINNRNGLWQINEVMRMSTDNGRTWGAVKTVAEGNELADDWHAAFGDPCIVADRESDQILMGCVAGKIGYWGENRSTRGRRQDCVFFRSNDGGHTWGPGELRTDDIWNLYEGTLPGGQSAHGLFLTSGKIMQSRYVKAGSHYRLYIAHPVRLDSFDKRMGTFVIYSDDFGKTWRVLGGTAAPASIAQDESKVEELPDGSVLLSCRDKDGGRRFNVYTYTDSKTAAGTWGEEVMPSNMTRDSINAVNGGIMVVSARQTSTGRPICLLLQSVPQSPERRTMGFYYKVVTNRTDYATPSRLAAGWVKGLKITDATACYSTMVLMDDGYIGLLYEKNSHNDGYDIVFQRLSLDEITGNQYHYDDTQPCRPT